MGIPHIGCPCEVCHSASAFNKRTRSAGLFTIQGKTLLLDVGPDFRMQALRHQITHLDGVLITHTHSDHIAGIDDLRVFYFVEHKKLPCLLSRETLQDIQLRYPYLFRPMPSDGKGIAAQLEFQVLEHDHGNAVFQGVQFSYFSYFQSGMKVTGFRYGNFAYVSDIREYDEKVFDHLKGVHTLVLSALRHHPTPMHFSLDEAIAFSRRANAKMTYLTHIAHDLDHEKTTALLPSDIRMSYDGLEIEI